MIHIKDNVVAVNSATKWQRITANTPRGIKLQLINRRDGVAMYGLHRPGDEYTHWFPAPTFEDDEDADN